MQQQRLAGLAILQAQRGRDLDALLRRARRLCADQRIGAVAVEALLRGRREVGIAQALGQALTVAAGVRVDPLGGLPERGLAAGLADFPFARELATLWQLACACEVRRGKPSARQGLNDYNFRIDGDLAAADPEDCRIEISERRRGSPLDKLVSELMIVANCTWGGLLAERGIAAIYRAQTAGKVRMTTAAEPHVGLGVAQYAWATSPLRRAADFVNQQQIVAMIRGETPRYKRGDADLFARLRDFDQAYNAYADFQYQMERFWCLRWFTQENVSDVTALWVKDDLVRIDGLPLAVRVAGLPEMQPGERVRLQVARIDELALEIEFRVLGKAETA